ncbi:MAG: hypothetical protein ISR96_03620 [Nitrospira sp.]|nr:hypothetical protein [bacterium]MBL7048604.1 hypothetical protein [Nitrospira sp.]
MKGTDIISHELHHEILGSIIDRDEITPYLLLRTTDYKSALAQASKMLANRGFDISDDHVLEKDEKARALRYIEQAYKYCFQFLFPVIRTQLGKLEALQSDCMPLYRDALKSLLCIEQGMSDTDFRDFIMEDPRHVLLVASSRKYPGVLKGYREQERMVPPKWQQLACSLLKVAYLIKSIEEDSQDVNDYAQLGLFLRQERQSLGDVYNYDWLHPEHLPQNEPARRAYVKLSTFFHKLKSSVKYNIARECMIFDSGDGVEIELEKIASRLKSPESMFTKLGKDIEGEAHNIRDMLAITFILKDRNDTLKLFHALQKQGVILQENTLSPSITQTLFNDADAMKEAVRILMKSLQRSEGTEPEIDDTELAENTEKFFQALNVNTRKNQHSSAGHSKFQCKLNFSIPIHRNAATNKIMIPGTATYRKRNEIKKVTEQHTLAVELRISDEQSWLASEQKGDSHHEAYKFRQLLTVINRTFSGQFLFPEEMIKKLRQDQAVLFQ